MFLTTDRGIPRQQNLGGLAMGVVLLLAPSNRMVDLLPLVSKINAALKAVSPGQLVRVAA